MLVEAIDIPHWLERDRQTNWRDRVARDRKLGVDDAGPTQSVKRVLHWWQALDKDVQEPSAGSEIARLFRHLSWTMLAAGTVSGMCLSSAVLHYDGSQPINVLVVLGWLVFLPFVFLVISVCLPWSATTSFGSEANIGAVILAFLKRRNPAAEAFFSAQRTNLSREKLLRWRLMLCSQQFGLAFSLAALGTLLFRVGFSDLAFGWSTTLSLDTDTVAGLFQSTAMPWAGWLADGVPTSELVAQSRYYRLEQGARVLSAETLTTWWLFVTMCLAVYGVGLRLVALTVAMLGYRNATRGMLLGHSEVIALVDRLNTPILSGQASTTEARDTHSDTEVARFDPSVHADLVILWNGARGTASDGGRVIEAGGERGINEDLDAVRDLEPPSNGIVRVVTKAWEPPLLELHDYLKALRERFGGGTSIVVHPVGEIDDTADARDIAVWRRSLARLQDPEVYVT